MTVPMNCPMVTVLVPTYNRAAFISDAIHTILTQTFTNFEIVVIDDGSDDETTDVLATFNDSRLRVLRQSHRGISAAMNAGLADARGRYISRLDSDDLWQPELLATLVPVLEAQQDVGVVYAQADALDHGMPVHHLQGLPLRYPDDSLRSLVYDDCTCNIALLARRECFERAGPYDEALIANEDWDMWLRVARHYRFVFIERVLARIRWHSGNLTGPTSSRLTDVLASRSVPLDKLFASPDLPVEIEAMRSIAYENVCLFRLLRWQQAGDRRAALREFRRLVQRSRRPALAVLRVIWRASVRGWLDRSPLGRALARPVAALYRRAG